VNLRIAFFGAYGSFDFFRIGGTESFARRLAAGLLSHGHRAYFVVYGAPFPQQHTLPSGIECYYFSTFHDSLGFVQENYDHVVAIYLRRPDRLSYAHFRRVNRHRLKFHQVLFSWPDSWLKRRAAFLETRLFPVNGSLFCISPRIHRRVSRWFPRAVLLLPPVPEEFFLTPSEKPVNERIRVAYIGRTEPRKGINDVLELFTRLKDSPGVELEIHGFHHKTVQAAVDTHEQLKRQKEIRYFYRPYDSYTPEVDQEVRRVLKETDILVLPYRKLSSTIDTPLLLLEGMASLCAIATRPLGDIPNIYGNGPFLFSDQDGVGSLADRILAGRQGFLEERRRLLKRNRELGFSTGQAVSLLLKSLDSR